MEEHSEEQLEAMGLCPNRKDLDQSIPFGTWPPRKDFHDKIKASTIQPEMPTSDDMWRYEQGTNNVSAVRCNAGIHICKVNAIVTGGGVGGVDLTLADEFFLCKKRIWRMVKEVFNFCWWESSKEFTPEEHFKKW